jgi:putative transposase
VSAFIDQERERFGVEPICSTLDVSASAYHHRNTGVRSVRVIEDERLTRKLREVHEANYECYGYRRMHAAMIRAGERVGRDQVRTLHSHRISDRGLPSLPAALGAHKTRLAHQANDRAGDLV